MTSHQRYQNETFALLYEQLFTKLSLPSELCLNENGKLTYFLNTSKGFEVISEPYFVKMIFYYVTHQSIIFESLQNFILSYRDFGFDERDENLQYSSLKRLRILSGDIELSKPRVLSLKMLEAGFALWFSLVPVACLLFIGECVFDYFSLTKWPKVNEFVSVREDLEDGKNIRITQLCSIDQSLLFDE